MAHGPWCKVLVITSIIQQLHYLCHFLLFITVVMACLMTIPAFSVSFFVRPAVTHTFRAG